MAWEPDSEEIRLRKQNDEINKLKQNQFFINSGINNNGVYNNLGTNTGSNGWVFPTSGEIQQTITNSIVGSFGILGVIIGTLLKVIPALSGEPTPDCATIGIINGGGLNNSGIVGQKVILKPDAGKTICLINNDTSNPSTNGNLIIGSNITIEQNQLVTLRYQDDIKFSDGVGGWIIESSSGVGGGGSSSSNAIKDPCRVATNFNYTNLSLVGENIDGVVVVTGDRVLVKSQTTTQNNGIYVVDSVTIGIAVLSRASDFANASIQKGSLLVAVQEGTVNADTLWQLTTNDIVTVGTTGLTFTEFIGGDNLGNHIATNDLDMQTFDILQPDRIFWATNVLIQAVDTSTPDGILDRLEYNVANLGAHDFFVDRPNTIIPRFGITETTIESNVPLKMHDHHILDIQYLTLAVDSGVTPRIEANTNGSVINILTNGINRVNISHNTGTGQGVMELFGGGGIGGIIGQSDSQIKTVSTKTASAVNTNIGEFVFDGKNSGGTQVSYGGIFCDSTEIGVETHRGTINIAVANGAGGMSPVMNIASLGIVHGVINKFFDSIDMIGTNILDIGFAEFNTISAPSHTTATKRYLFQDSADNHLKIRTNSGLIDLETGGGDNLGNHIATNDLDMQTFDILQPDRIFWATNVFIQAVDTSTPDGILDRLEYNVANLGAHDFFVDRPNTIIPRFGITETSLESNVMLNMNTNQIIKTTLLGIVDTGGVSRGSLSGGSSSEIILSFASGQKFTIKNLITEVARFDPNGLTMNAHKITGLLNPTDPTDAVNVDYFNTTGDLTWLALDGTSVMTGNINAGNKNLINVNDINIVRSDGVARATLTASTPPSSQLRLDLASGVDFFLSEVLSDIIGYNSTTDVLTISKATILSGSGTTISSATINLGDADSDVINFVGIAGTALDMNGNSLILDPTGNSSISSSVDNAMTFRTDTESRLVISNSLADFEVGIDMSGNSIDNVGFLISNATNPSTVGTIRLGNAQSINWRNQGNTENLWLEVGTSNSFDFINNSVDLLRINANDSTFITNIVMSGAHNIAMGNNNITGLNSLQFNEPNQTITDSITGLDFNVPDALDVYDFVIEGNTSLTIEKFFLNLRNTRIQMLEEAVPSTPPPANQAYVFLNNATGELSIIKDTGSVISLEGGETTSFADNIFDIHDNDTPSKILQFSLASMFEGTSILGTNTLTATRTWTLPDISSTIAVLGGTQTFSGAKTFTGGVNITTLPLDLGSQNINSVATLNVSIVSASTRLKLLNFGSPTSNGDMQLDSTDVKVYSGGAVRNLSKVGGALQVPHRSDGSGYYTSPTTGVSGSFSQIFLPDTLYAIPFVPQETMTVDALALKVITVGSGTVDAWLGIYNSKTDGTLYPDQRVATWSAKKALTSLGEQSAGITPASVQLKGGELYWLAYIQEDGTTEPEITSFAGHQMIVVMARVAGGLGDTSPIGLSVTSTFSNTEMPSSFPAGASVRGDNQEHPAIFVRVKSIP